MSSSNHNRRWYRFSLRTLLIFTFLCVVLTWAFTLLWRSGHFLALPAVMFYVGVLIACAACVAAFANFLAWLKRDK